MNPLNLYQDALNVVSVAVLAGDFETYVAMIDLPRAGRFRVWVDWQEIAFPAEASRISQAVYYCRHTALGLRTEMLNYTFLSMPELNGQFEALALSA